MTQAADDIISNLRKRFPDREYFGLVADLKGKNNICYFLFILFRRDTVCYTLRLSLEYSRRTSLWIINTWSNGSSDGKICFSYPIRNWLNLFFRQLWFMGKQFGLFIMLNRRWRGACMSFAFLFLDNWIGESQNNLWIFHKVWSSWPKIKHNPNLVLDQCVG